MNNLIIDTAGDEIFLKFINKDKEYNIKHNNSREKFDGLVKIIFDFIKNNNIQLSNINNIFINQGPGKFTSIRSAISIVKAIKISNNVNIYWV
jgi:Inactive homolog of metal-dependent proteases, putative molecular chaperone